MNERNKYSFKLNFGTGHSTEPGKVSIRLRSYKQRMYLMKTIPSHKR